MMGDMMNQMGSWGWLGMLIFWLFAIALLVLVVVAIVWHVRTNGPQRPVRSRPGGGIDTVAMNL